MIQAIRKPIQQTTAPRHHHIAQQMRPHIHIHLAQTALDQRGQRLPRRRRRARRVRQRHLRVEQPLRGPVPLRAEQLVVAVGELEGPAGLCGRERLVGAAVRVVRAEPAGAGPDLHDGFFEFRQHALFLQAAEGEVRGVGGGEGAVGGGGRGAGVDGRFRGYEVVRGEGNWGRRGGEEEAQLVGDEVAGEGGARDAFFEEEAVVDGGYGGVGGADVDYEGGGFARSEAGRSGRQSLWNIPKR